MQYLHFMTKNSNFQLKLAICTGRHLNTYRYSQFICFPTKKVIMATDKEKMREVHAKDEKRWLGNGMSGIGQVGRRICLLVTNYYYCLHIHSSQRWHHFSLALFTIQVLVYFVEDYTYSTTHLTTAMWCEIVKSVLVVPSWVIDWDIHLSRQCITCYAQPG